MTDAEVERLRQELIGRELDNIAGFILAREATYREVVEAARTLRDRAISSYTPSMTGRRAVYSSDLDALNMALAALERQETP